MFLDVIQAYNRGWYEGLKKQLPKRDSMHNCYPHISLSQIWGVEQEEVYTELKLTAGIPQGSGLSPILYLLYTYTNKWVRNRRLSPNEHKLLYINFTYNIKENEAPVRAKNEAIPHIDIIKCLDLKPDTK